MINFLSYQLKKTTGFVLFGGFILVLFMACQNMTKDKSDIGKVEKLAHSGEFKKAGILADSLKSAGFMVAKDLAKLDSILEIGRRIQRDFRLTETDIKNRLANYFPDLQADQLRNWEQNKKLEMRWIDGERRYFINAVGNLFRLDDAAAKRRNELEGCQADSLKLFCLKHTQQIINETKISGETVLPKKIKLNYAIQVKPNAVPDGYTIRCWMPFPREGNVRHKNIELVKSDPELAMISPESDFQRTVYLEKKAVKDQETVFRIELEVETAAQYFDLQFVEIKPYQTESNLYKEYTSERAPQIVFTENIKKLAEQIVAGETNPITKVQKIFQWIDDSIRWASALEYCTMADIPGYVLDTGHGDCGMQTLLFMTLARSQGIPVKWQSGWMLHPREVNLHDWCEVYYEGVGWVPLDQSFGLQGTNDQKLRNFYRSGIDSYRLIVNDDYGRALSPIKKFMRSEPYDFQRGELEWDGGNLYFDQWSWHMDVEYLK